MAFNYSGSSSANPFGSKTEPSIFGTSTKGDPAASSSALSFGTSSSAGSLFGAVSNAPTFGTATSSSGLFGSSSNPAPAFGASATPASAGFGATAPATSSANLFGAPATSAAPLASLGATPSAAFGSSISQSSSFGAPPKAALSFGATPTTTGSFAPSSSNLGSGFGAGGGFALGSTPSSSALTLPASSSIPVASGGFLATAATNAAPTPTIDLTATGGAANNATLPPISFAPVGASAAVTSSTAAFGFPSSATTSAPTNVPATSTPFSLNPSTSQQAQSAAFAFGTPASASAGSGSMFGAASSAAATGTAAAFSFDATATAGGGATTASTSAAAFSFAPKQSEAGSKPQTSAAGFTLGIPAASTANSKPASSSFNFPAPTSSAATTSGSSGASTGLTTFPVLGTDQGNGGSSAPATAQPTSGAITTVGFGTAAGTTSNVVASASGVVTGFGATAGAQQSTAQQSTAPMSVPSDIKDLSLDEVVNKWTEEIADLGSQFQKGASLVSRWDRMIVANEDRIVALHKDAQSLQIAHKELSNNLDVILSQQSELHALLDKLETDVEQKIGVSTSQKETRSSYGSNAKLHGDVEREIMHKLSIEIMEELDAMALTIRDLVLDLNKGRDPSSGEGAGDTVSQIIAVLNAHLDSLQYLDETSNSLQKRLTDVSNACEVISRESNRMFGRRVGAPY